MTPQSISQGPARPPAKRIPAAIESPRGPFRRRRERAWLRRDRPDGQQEQARPGPGAGALPSWSATLLTATWWAPTA